jgi:hypothetical protein
MARFPAFKRCFDSWRLQADFLRQLEPDTLVRLGGEPGGDPRLLQLATAWNSLKAAELFLVVADGENEAQDLSSAVEAARQALDALRKVEKPPPVPLALAAALAGKMATISAEGFVVGEGSEQITAELNRLGSVALRRAAGPVLAAALATSEPRAAVAPLLEPPAVVSDASGDEGAEDEQAQKRERLREAMATCPEALVLPLFGLRRLEGRRFELISEEDKNNDRWQKVRAFTWLMGRGTEFDQRLEELKVRLPEGEDLGNKDGKELVPWHGTPPFGALIDWPLLLLLLALHSRGLVSLPENERTSRLAEVIMLLKLSGYPVSKFLISEPLQALAEALLPLIRQGR